MSLKEIITKKSVIVILLVLCVFIGNLVRYSYRSPPRKYSDYRVFHKAGENFINKKDLYARPDEAITPFKYSPVFAMLMTPLAQLPIKISSRIFWSFNFLAFILILFLSKRLITKEQLTFKQYWILFFFPILFTSRFIINAWDSGSMNVVMLLLVIISLWTIHKDQTLLSACALALSIMFKYMPVIFIPYFLLRGKPRLAIWTGVLMAFYCLLPAIYLGVDLQWEYLSKWIPSILGNSFDPVSWYHYKNQSIFSMALRLFTVGTTEALPFAQFGTPGAMRIGIIISIFIYILILYPKKSHKNHLLDYALLLLCMAIFNPNAWMMNFVNLIFAYVLLMYYLIKVRFKDFLTLGLVIVSFMLTSWASESIVGNDIEILLERYSSVTFGTLLVIFALLRLKYKNLLEQIA